LLYKWEGVAIIVFVACCLISTLKCLACVPNIFKALLYVLKGNTLLLSTPPDNSFAYDFYTVSVPHTLSCCNGSVSTCTPTSELFFHFLEDYYFF
jgi:hypothetical protein